MYALVSTFVHVARFEARFSLRFLGQIRLFAGALSAVILIFSFASRSYQFLGLFFIFFAVHAFLHFFVLFIAFYKDLKQNVIRPDMKIDEVPKGESILEYFDFEAT